MGCGIGIKTRKLGAISFQLMNDQYKRSVDSEWKDYLKIEIHSDIEA